VAYAAESGCALALVTYGQEEAGLECSWVAAARISDLQIVRSLRVMRIRGTFSATKVLRASATPASLSP